MSHVRTLVLFTGVSVFTLAAFLVGCDRRSETPAKPSTTTSAGNTHHDHADHDHDDHEDHAHDHSNAVIELGEKAIGAFNVKATRDQGQIVAGGDAPIDVTVSPAAGATVKATAVRLWIGTQDAKGSLKAKAEIENAQEPNRWHTHAEIPNPIPAGSKLWVEIEDDKGAKTAGSFDLKS